MSSIVALFDPKYIENLGQVKRACACWGINNLLFSGNRIAEPVFWNNEYERLPRELRHLDYKSVSIQRVEKFKDVIKEFKVIPVCIELVPNSENLFDFTHPENAMYIFGPEDGSVPSTIRQHCHHFVSIPTNYCLNLAMAVNIVLADRAYKKHIRS